MLVVVVKQRNETSLCLRSVLVSYVAKLNLPISFLFCKMFGWLGEKLPTQKKVPVEVNLIIPILYSCLESRSADVRKKAQGALPAFMNLVGWDTMVKQTGKLKVMFTKCFDQECHVNNPE